MAIDSRQAAWSSLHGVSHPASRDRATDRYRCWCSQEQKTPKGIICVEAAKSSMSFFTRIWLIEQIIAL